ncbi:MAG: cYT1 [Candidatus Midichloriaceae bacterium]|jgi:ubiquinol-cytochrome c reductase cytochrome c1 subunit|nr:cYT1 [Candidatus Midichloriaceae bacterium]
MRFVFLVLFIIISAEVMASGDTLEPLHPKHVDWSFDGAFGSVDREAAQRGFKVYKEVCSACHSLKRIAFRNLMELGFSEAEVKSLAASYSIKDGPNSEGEMFERPGRTSDYFVGPYANENAARASNNGALPPDLSLIVKARKGGADYIYSLLTGYENPPEAFQLGENMHYNPYFAGGGAQFAMTPPLTSDGQVEYTDGTNPTVDQMAKDIVNFLQWTAEPEMESRKSLGVKILIFASLFTGIMYFAYKRIWRDVK